MTLNIGVIGTGMIGRDHTRRIQQVLAGAEVVALSDVNLASAESVRNDLAPHAKLYETGEALIAAPEVDAVLVTSWGATHEPYVLAAIAAGKPVFCEKPLALTKAEAERSVALCRDAGLVLGMGHERRFEPPVAEMLAMADAGTLGRIHQIEANFSHDKFLSLARDNWRLKADQAPAGGMTATGIHLLDLSVRLLGAAESVLCICEQLSSDLPQGDTVAAFVKFKGGGTSYVSASLANPFMSRFTVYGSHGWIDIRDKAHVEAPDGWIVTSAMKGGPIITTEIGSPPVLILDDVLSELDPHRSAALLRHFPLGQVLITSAGVLPKTAHPDSLVHIAGGTIRED